MTGQIDAHQHVWQIGRNGCTWPGPDLAAIHDNFLPTDWQAAAAGTGLTGSILVQSQPCDADTDWLLQQAAAFPHVQGVVGWVDLAAPDAVARIDKLAENRWLKGMRPMLQSIPDDGWILQKACAGPLERMEHLGLALDALVFSRHLWAIERVAARHPSLTVVIDHGAKPPLASRDMRQWQSAIGRLAKYHNVFCKWSGLATELSPDQPIKMIDQVSRSLLDLFGPDRLIWGSDWPVCNLRTTLTHWYDLCTELVPDVETQDAIFGNNARKVYRLTDVA